MTATIRQRDAVRSRQIGTDPGQDWRTAAACRDADTELFYPPPGHTTRPEALAYCRHCPVTAQCLAFAHQTGDDWAVLGGTTAHDRRMARRHRTPAAGPVQPRTAAANAARRRTDLDQHIHTVRRYAAQGWSDTRIADLIGDGISASQVQYLRRREHIPAGQRSGWPRKELQNA